MTKIGKVQVDPSITPDSIPDRVFLRPARNRGLFGVYPINRLPCAKRGNSLPSGEDVSISSENRSLH